MIAFAMMAPFAIRPMPRRLKNAATSSEKTSFLIRWSIQEIRRIAIKLSQRRIQPAHVFAWSLWRRAHQAQAHAAHLKEKMQL
jgi:hypothetical protein